MSTTDTILQLIEDINLLQSSISLLSNVCRLNTSLLSEVIEENHILSSRISRLESILPPNVDLISPVSLIEELRRDDYDIEEPF